MAWVKKTVNQVLYTKELLITLPSSAIAGYSSEIGFAHVGRYGGVRYMLPAAQASAVTGANIDFALYGAYASGGTKYLLLDAIIADITDATFTIGTAVDLWAYPMPYYYIAHTVDQDEDANTISYHLTFASDGIR